MDVEEGKLEEELVDKPGVRPRFGRSAGPLLRRTAQNFAFFFPRQPQCSGASHDSPRTPNVHIFRTPAFENTTKIPRKDPQEKKKERKLWRKREKREILGLPTLRGPTLRGPSLLGPTLRAPHFFQVWAPTLRRLHPSGPLPFETSSYEAHRSGTHPPPTRWPKAALDWTSQASTGQYGLKRYWPKQVAARYCALVDFLQWRGRWEFPSFPNDQVQQVSPEPWDLWVTRCINLPLLRRHWTDSEKSLCGEATRCFHDDHWSVLTSCSLLCFVIPTSQKHWRHGLPDDRILRNLPSYSLQIDSMISRVLSVQVPYHFSFSDSGRKKDQWPRGNLRAQCATVCEL